MNILSRSHDVINIAVTGVCEVKSKNGAGKTFVDLVFAFSDDSSLSERIQRSEEH